MAHPKCGARNRSGGTCQLAAGHGTDHTGEGRCKHHGGATPIKHGRYSRIQRPRVKELIDSLQSDPDPLDLLPEVQAIRALTIDYIERYDAFVAALLAWHESFSKGDGEESRPRQVLDVADAARLLERAARVVDLIQKHRKEGTLSMEAFNRVMEQMGVSVARHVKDPATLRRIEAEWLAIQVS